MKKLSKILTDRITKHIKEAGAPELYWTVNDFLTSRQLCDILSFPDWESRVYPVIERHYREEIKFTEANHLVNIVKEYSDFIADELNIAVQALRYCHFKEVIADNNWMDIAPHANLNIAELLKRRPVQVVLQLDLFFDYNVKSWHRNISYYKVKKQLSLFNINPVRIHHSLPDIPERDGHEFIDPQELKDLWNQALEGGRYVILLEMNLADYVQRRAHYHTGLQLPEGMRICLYNYAAGTGAQSITLKKPITLCRHKIAYYFGEDEMSVGEPFCLGMKVEPDDWQHGIQPVELPSDSVEYFPSARAQFQFQLSPVGNSIQDCGRIRAYNTPISRNNTIDKQGIYFRADMLSEIPAFFPKPGIQYLKTKAEKDCEYLAFSGFEQLGEFRINHFYCIINETQQKVVWSKVFDTSRSWCAYKCLLSAVPNG